MVLKIRHSKQPSIQLQPPYEQKELTYPSKIQSCLPEEYERELYKVECKCGNEYFCSMNVARLKARCRICKATVFADYQADKVIDPTYGTAAVLLTNKYWVERENADAPSIQPITHKHGKDYVDPFNPFGKDET